MTIYPRSTSVLLLKISDHRDREWVDAFRHVMPDLEVRVWPEVGNPSEIAYAVLWNPPAKLFPSLTKLEVIFSVGAGVDHLLACPTLPRDIPIVRMVEPALTSGMVEYVVYHVLRFHRRMDLYENQQRESCWRVLPQPLPSATTVGVMGMGVLGSAVTSTLQFMGFKVLGWSRTRKVLEGIESYAGESELPQFLSRSVILVLLLPLTESTAEIMNAKRFAQMPQGSFFVNAGRGGLVVERDLMVALDTGWITGATLDVVAEEPLPSGHWLWNHPAVVITPHIASITNPNTASVYIVSNIHRHREGEQMTGLVDLETFT